MDSEKIEARAPSPIYWKQISPTLWLGDGRSRWKITKSPSGDFSISFMSRVTKFGGTAKTLESAKQRVAGEELEGDWHTVKHADGSGSVEHYPSEDDELPPDPQLERPEPLDRDCPECRAPNSVICLKPVHGSAGWWDDPYYYWICSACHKIVWGTMEVHKWERKMLGKSDWE